MEVHTGLEAQQTGVVLRVFVGAQSFVGSNSIDPVNAMHKDIVVDAVGKQCQLCRQILRREVEAQVSLQTVFRLQLMVAHLIAQRAFVGAV